MDYKSLLLELLAVLKISKKKFAETLLLSQGNVSDWFNKPNVRPSIDALRKISLTYNVNINWLLTGKGDMFISSMPSIPSIDTSADLPLTSIPIYSDIAAGSPYPATYGEPLEVIQVPTQLLVHPGPYLAFKVNGQSMEPLIMHADYVVLSQTWKGLSLNNRICAFRTPDGITLKTYLIDKKSKCVFLFPVNQAHNYMVYDKSVTDLVMFGILILSIRKYI